MSTLTGLISAGGSGGGGGESNIITDPKKLLKTAFSRAYIKGAATGTDESRNASFFTTIVNATNMAATVATASNDTYVTLLNASNADGGYLHFIVSPGIETAGQSVTVKITVDGGTPVELVYQPVAINASIGSNRMFLGGGFQVASFPTSVSTFSYSSNFWNAYDPNFYGGGSTFKNQEDATNSVYINNNNSFNQGYIQADYNILRGMPYQRLYFTSSLLVEVKQSTFNTTNANERALCFYSLI